MCMQSSYQVIEYLRYLHIIQFRRISTEPQLKLEKNQNTIGLMPIEQATVNARTSHCVSQVNENKKRPESVAYNKELAKSAP